MFQLRRLDLTYDHKHRPYIAIAYRARIFNESPSTTLCTERVRIIYVLCSSYYVVIVAQCVLEVTKQQMWEDAAVYTTVFVCSVYRLLSLVAFLDLIDVFHIDKITRALTHITLIGALTLCSHNSILVKLWNSLHYHFGKHWSLYLLLMCNLAFDYTLLKPMRKRLHERRRS